jgi:toxin-antitoxin system PIN domain toxin
LRVCLLDVNTLVALAWPNHVHHAPAMRWFSAHHSDGWATCPLTESGFVRVSSSPLATTEAKSPAEALFLLRKIVALPGHSFWDDDVSLALSEHVDPTKLVGYRQITDAHLVALTIRRGGRLVTFDRGVRQILPASSDSDDLLILLD